MMILFAFLFVCKQNNSTVELLFFYLINIKEKLKYRESSVLFKVFFPKEKHYKIQTVPGQYTVNIQVASGRFTDTFQNTGPQSY